MSSCEIKDLIEKVLDERINSAVERMSHQKSEFDKRKDLETEEGSVKREILQKRIDRLDLLIEILQNLKQI